MVAFTKLKAGDTVFDVHRYKTNGGGSRLGCWTVQIISTDPETQSVTAKWNGNPAKRFGARAIRRWRRSQPKLLD